MQKCDSGCGTGKGLNSQELSGQQLRTLPVELPWRWQEQPVTVPGTARVEMLHVCVCASPHTPTAWFPNQRGILAPSTSVQRDMSSWRWDTHREGDDPPARPRDGPHRHSMGSVYMYNHVRFFCGLGL